ncbi:MAG: OmpA family protein [Myxococcales bacterium]|nr:OmpA family protein [Myxococcales bacterium]
MAAKSRAAATRGAIGGAALVAVLLVAASAGEARPRLDVGAYTGVLVLDDGNELGNAWAPEQVPGVGAVLGVRLGFVPWRWSVGRGYLELGAEAEARLSLAATGSEPAYGRNSYSSPVVGVHAQFSLAYAPSADARWVPFLLVGGGPETVFSSSPYVQTDADAAAYWGAGVRYQLQPTFALRLDLRQGVTAGRDAERSYTYEVGLGISKAIMFGRPPRPSLPQDRDDDGIVDATDKCPEDAETYNSYEDDDGCPDNADLDNDGIKNQDDKCPERIENFNGIADDDGCPETDDDNDRILSNLDKCPDVAEDYDKFEDEDGCPDVDNDRDGVSDALDECPAEPELRNGYRDEDGCPDELPREIAKYAGVVPGISFEMGDARIKKSSNATLKEAVRVFRKYPELRISIIGHTDDIGTREENLDLSKRRAEAVKWWLVDRGIMPERIEAFGKGPDEPKVPNTSPQNRELNRRIEFQLIIAPPVVAPPPSAPPAAAPAAPKAAPAAPKTAPVAPKAAPGATLPKKP